jgi:DNA-binding Lrp family transcriptional regulator
MSDVQPGLLAPLGVSELDERVYRTLLGTPEANQQELADAVDETVARVAPALRRLEALGLVGRLGGRPRRYVPALPDVAIDALLHSRQRRLLQARAAIPELTSEYRAGRHDDPGALVEILTGEVAVAQRFAELQHSCRDELLLFDRPPYVASPDNPQQGSVLGRGVRWRTIYASRSLDRSGAREHVDGLMTAGEEARVLPDLPMKLLVVDRRVALLPLTLGSELRQSAVIHRSTLLDAMVTLFEVFWERAMPLTSGAAAADDRLAAEDRRLLSLLVMGAKDEAIARDLDIGVRTLRRRMQRLLQTLGAETRFQAGMQAVRQGLI